MPSSRTPTRATGLNRRAFTTTMALAGTGLAGRALAQPAAFPTKAVTIVTAFPVGSGPDAVLRIVGEKLAARWKQSVVVENRPGGGGFVAIEAVRRARPDGHTLLQLDSEHVSALPYLYKQRSFTTLQAFDFVAPLFITPFFVAVSAQSPWKSMADLIAAARSAPEKISYGSWGPGSPGHLGGEWLGFLTDAKMVHVPYKEMGQLFTAVANGDLQWSFASLPSSQGVYRAGKIRYLAIAAPARIPQMPDTPTMAQAGGPAELIVNSFVSLLAPKGIAAALRDQIHADVLAVLQDPQVAEKFSTFAFQPLSWSIAEMQKNAQAKAEQYRMLIEKANISLD